MTNKQSWGIILPQESKLAKLLMGKTEEVEELRTAINNFITSKSEQMEREKSKWTRTDSMKEVYRGGYNAGISKAIEILKK